MSDGSSIVVGAGLSGLACAFDLARGGRHVVVLEAAGRAGGVVGSIERDGFRFETGPNTIQASAAAFRTLCGDVGIAERLIVSPPEQRDRFLFVRGRLRALPSTPLEFLTSPVLSLGSRLFVCSEPLRKWKPPSDGVEPDLAALLTERLGAEAARVLAGAFVRGVYAAELAELGAASAMPRLWRALEEHGSLVRGLRALGRQPAVELPGPRVPRSSLLSFPDGLHELVAALARELGARLRTSCAATRIGRAPSRSGSAPGGRWRVVSSVGESLEAEELVLAVPARIAARLLADVSGPSSPLEALARIVHSRVTLVHLGFERGGLRELPAGFGYLVPPPALTSRGGIEAGSNPPRDARSAAPLVLGTIFASNLFPGRAPRDCAAVTSFYRSGDVESMKEHDLIAQACRDLALVLQRAEAPRARVAAIQRWDDVIPHYAPGHRTRMNEILEHTRAALPGLHLAGSYVAGVSVDDVIARGRAVAAEILGRDSDSRPQSGDAPSTALGSSRARGPGR